MMSEEAKKKIQIALALAIVVAGVRAGYILYERHEDYVAAQKQRRRRMPGIRMRITTSRRRSCIRSI